MIDDSFIPGFLFGLFFGVFILGSVIGQHYYKQGQIDALQGKILWTQVTTNEWRPI